MKSFAVAAIATACLTMPSVQGLPTYLEQIPNGSKFSSGLTHDGSTSSGKYTAFGTAFINSGMSWDKDFCETTFPGAQITVGQAFGDPCCVWKQGDTPAHSVNAFTTNPGAGAPACAPAPAATTRAPVPAATTRAPAPANTPRPPANTPRPPANTPRPPAPRPTRTPRPANQPGNKCKKTYRK